MSGVAGPHVGPLAMLLRASAGARRRMAPGQCDSAARYMIGDAAAARRMARALQASEPLLAADCARYAEGLEGMARRCAALAASAELADGSAAVRPPPTRSP